MAEELDKVDEAPLKASSGSSSRSASYSPSPPQSHRSADGDSVKSRKSSSSPYSNRRRRRSPSSPRSKEEAVSVEISGLTKAVTESHLRHIFGQYGSIEEVVIPISRDTGENKGRAWIIYRSSINAEKAEEYMSGGQIDGVIISVRQSHINQEDRRRESRRSYEVSRGSRGNDRDRRQSDYFRSYDR